MASTSVPLYDAFMVDIVQYFYSQPHFSAHALRRARLAILDSLGCAIETATQSSECGAMLGPVVPNIQTLCGCRLPGTALELDPMKGAFDLGTMIRYLDHNDGYIGQEWGHPSDMLGAILSVADWQTRQSLAAVLAGNTGRKDSDVLHNDPPGHERGQVSAEVPACVQPRPDSTITIRQVLEATIKAYETHCLFQHTNSFNRLGFDHTILVKVGAVVAVCWLLGLSMDDALAALSQVYQDGVPLRTYRQTPNVSPRKGWAAGDACMRAVHLAFLTRLGQPGAPTVLTDPNWGFYANVFRGNEFVVTQEYGSFAIEHNAFKLMVGEGHGISACNAALLALQQLESIGKATREICNICIRTVKPAVTIIHKTGPLRNPADRDHCLSYMVAVTFLKGSFLQAEDYTDDSSFAHSAEVERLRKVMSVYEDPELTQNYLDPAKRTLATGLTITLHSDLILDEVFVETPLGFPQNPGTDKAVLKKFHKNMALAFETSVADQVIAALEQDTLPISTLMNLVWKG